MPVLHTADAVLPFEIRGAGVPVTVLAGGLGSRVAETRLLGTGLPGQKVFFAFRGHPGAVALPGAGWGFADLAADLRAVADHVGATRAIGLSLGAGALVRLLAATPVRFERAAFLLPAVLDRSAAGSDRTRLLELARCLDTRDRAGLERLEVGLLPREVRSTPDARAYVAARTDAMIGTQLADLVRGLVGDVPVPDRAVLAAVRARCLVVAQEDDPVHPVPVARELAAALPEARLEVFERPVVWLERARLRGLLADFVATGPPSAA